MRIFWWPGNMNLALGKASVTCSLLCIVVRMDIVTWLLWILTTVPWAFPKAWRICVWRPSAPAQGNSLYGRKELCPMTSYDHSITWLNFILYAFIRWTLGGISKTLALLY